ncbi:methyltransferase domain-containing protein [Candidatus Peregrinibacteria bacterium]|nr:methyltransferase domain-containing protein [Candidatus Peregrinibacteria bacterium]
MNDKTTKILLNKVKSSYNQIANEFSDTRVYPWKEFDLFKPYLQENDFIIDLGCGNGRLLNYLYKKYLNNNFKYLGIDNSEGLLKKAKAIHDEGLFILGDQLEIPLADNKADIIFNIAAFHHIPSYKLRMKALKEMRRVLKKDGILIITVWNLWQKKYLKYTIKAILLSIVTFGKYSFNDFFIPWKKNDGKVLSKRYYHSFLPSEINTLCKKAGFEIVENFAVKKGQKVSFLNSFNYCLVLKKL